ncbi:AMP-binding protein [Desulfobaculum bizertense]|uniref:AMP-binding protein n=1 Tax=Desulfobaculum bizertense TaxID=376490 RepID=UPI003D73EDF7
MSTEAIRHITLGRILDETVSRYPDEDAVIYVDREFRLTWKEFGGLVDDLAKGLMALGIQRGEKLVLWATNLPYWVAFQFATAKIGAVLLPLNTSYKSAELECR